MTTAISIVIITIISLFIEKLYLYYYAFKPWIEIRDSFYQDSKGYAKILHIKNVGFSNFAPYDVVLYNLEFGSFIIFNETSTSQREPGETDDWKCYISNIDIIVQMAQAEINNGKWVFLLKLKNSKRIIYKNAELGNSLISYLLDKNNKNIKHFYTNSWITLFFNLFKKVKQQ